MLLLLVRLVSIQKEFTGFVSNLFCSLLAYDFCQTLFPNFANDVGSDIICGFQWDLNSIVRICCVLLYVVWNRGCRLTSNIVLCEEIQRFENSFVLITENIYEICGNTCKIQNLIGIYDLS